MLVFNKPALRAYLFHSCNFMKIIDILYHICHRTLGFYQSLVVPDVQK
ncbi:hypothetical protein VRK_09660 [Vibrio sp. MEBiC08052]|nr:hypothetical protein VRK_09660 [Vibrio sp. MEBiC08052]